MLTKKQKTNLVSLNKKQARLVERFEKLGKQLDKAGVAILVDEEFNDICYAITLTYRRKTSKKSDIFRLPAFLCP